MKSLLTTFSLIFVLFTASIAQISDKTVVYNLPLSPEPFENRCCCFDVIIKNSQKGINYFVRDFNTKQYLSNCGIGNNQDIKINAGPVNATTTVFVQAQNIDKSLLFDGINDYALTATMVPFPTAFSITARIKTTDNSGELFCWTGSGTNNFASFGVYMGHLRYSTGNGTGAQEYIDGVTSITGNVWHHVALTNDGSQIKLYVDGVLDKTQAFTQKPTPNKSSVGGGYLNDYLQSFYSGYMDDLTIWTTALTALDITVLNTTNPVGNETQLFLNYDFDNLPDSILENKRVTNAFYHGRLFGMGASSAITDQIRDSLNLTGTQTITTYPNHQYSFPLSDVCIGRPFGFQIEGTDINYDYYLRRDADNFIYDGPVAGTGSAIYTGIASLSNAETLNVMMKETDQSLSFDGTDDYIEISPMIPLTDTITVMARIKSTDNSGSILTWGAEGVNNFASLQIYQSHLRFSCGKSTATRVIMDGSAIIDDNAWHHVSLVKKGKEIELYVDGKLDLNGSVLEIPSPVRSDIGAGFMNGIIQNNYAGTINDISIWNKALRSSQIECFSSSKPWGADKGLIAFYNFDHLPAASLQNKAQDTYHGTFYNMPTLSVIEPASSEEIQLSNKVTILLSAGCLDKTQDMKVDNDFYVFPNPCKNILQIKNLNSQQIRMIQIKNTAGKIIGSYFGAKKPNMEIDISNLKTGFYFVTITFSDNTITRKIIKE